MCSIESPIELTDKRRSEFLEESDSSLDSQKPLEFTYTLEESDWMVRVIDATLPAEARSNDGGLNWVLALAEAGVSIVPVRRRRDPWEFSWGYLR